MATRLQSIMDDLSTTGYPSVADLCRLAPEALVPVVPAEPPPVPIAAVHISELIDPTPYLDGGELLLTTGLELPRRGSAIRPYVARLRAVGVAALALGLGPKHRSVPSALLAACLAEELPLLVVPDIVPFQRVTRTFWQTVGEEQLRAHDDALGSQRRLVAAAASDAPREGVLRALGEGIGGSAALLDLHGDIIATWPPRWRADAATLAAEADRLHRAGPRSSATFPLGTGVAALHPVLARHTATGYLATVSDRAQTSTDRVLVLTSLALLGLDAGHREEARIAARTARIAVGVLIERQAVPAAQTLAEQFGLALPARDGRVVVAWTDGSSDPLDALEQVVPEGDGGPICGSGPGSAWVLLGTDLMPRARAVRERLMRLAPDVRIVLGPVADLASTHDVTQRMVAQARRAPPGAVESWADVSLLDLLPREEADHLLRPLDSYRRADLRAALAAYLRHHGQWEDAARALGLHRNSLRGRIGRVESLLGESLDDPDARARLWLALRVSGSA